MTFTPRAPRSDRSHRPAIRIHSVDELITYLPYALGYVPHQALIVVALRRKEMLLTANMSFADLVDPDADATEVLAAGAFATSPTPAADPVRAAAEQLVRAVVRADADSLHLFVHEDAPGEGDALVSAVEGAARRERIRIGGHVVIRGDRKWLPQSPDVRERVDGVPIVAHPDSPAVVARMVQGCSPLADRTHLRALVEEDDALSGPVVAALEKTELTASRRAAVWGRWLNPSGKPAVPPGNVSPREVAELLLSLTDVNWRDALIAWAAPGSLPVGALPAPVRRALRRHLPESPSDRLATMRVLMRLARSAPDARPEISAPIVTVVGCVAWHLGEGATARDAFERALRIDPGYRLAQLGFQVVQLAIRPPHPGRGHGVPSVKGAAV